MLNEVGDADRASVRAIARRAGVSPTALYLQFPDRDSLVAAAVDAGFETFNRELLTAASIDASPTERLMEMGRAYLAFYEQRPALYATLFSTRRTLVDKEPDVDRDQALDGVVTLLQLITPDARLRRGVRAGDPDLVVAARLRDAARRPPAPRVAGAGRLPAPPAPGLRPERSRADLVP